MNKTTSLLNTNINSSEELYVKFRNRKIEPIDLMDFIREMPDGDEILIKLHEVNWLEIFEHNED